MAVIAPLLSLLSLAPGRDLAGLSPPYPRIGNCYGSGLGWSDWERGRGYWSKLGLFIGGGYDLHYDWDSPRWPQALARIEDNVRRIREVNPTALVLPYVDVIEGVDSPEVPQAWWELRDGQRWSGWPGMFRVNTALREVLEHNLAKVREQVLGHEVFDGVFYDCWHPDDWLVPETAKLRGGAAVVMVNDWNLPREGFQSLNGCLAEDELNRVVEGRVDFEDFLARYLRWCRESRKPCTTTIVCHPRGMDMDPWRWDKVPWQERTKVAEGLRDSDPQMMRFGLTTTLLGDGYFGYDCANLGRGQWWWYPEFDAPLGQPRGPARRDEDGVWRRDFDGGTVVVNGTAYDAVVEAGRNCRDLSTGRVGRQFTLPMFDGRILLPSDEAPTPQPDAKPRLTPQPPAHVEAVELDRGIVALRAPSGLELRLEPTGEVARILFRGREVMSGGFPAAYLQPLRQFGPEGVTRTVSVEGGAATARFQGTLVCDESRVAFTQECTVEEGGTFTLRFDFEALTDLDLRMWRHFFFLPVADYAGAKVKWDEGDLTLPAALGDADLLPPMGRLTVRTRDLAVTVEPTPPMSLVDHRKWGTQDYLLSSYPVGGKVAKGTRFSAQVRVAVEAVR